MTELKNKRSRIEIWICDDSRPMANLLYGFIEKALKELHCNYWIETFYQGMDLFRFFQDEMQKPDIIFLAARMKNTTGFRIAQNLQTQNCSALLIFVSLYEEMILPSLPFQPFGFIIKARMHLEVKPFLEKALIALKLQEKSTLFYFYKGVECKIPYVDIIYIQSSQKSLHIIQTGNREALLWNTLRNVYEILPRQDFLKISASCIVNVQHVSGILQKDILCSDGSRLPISRSEYHAVLSFLNGRKENA